jgi:hypothetical protein
LPSELRRCDAQTHLRRLLCLKAKVFALPGSVCVGSASKNRLKSRDNARIELAFRQLGRAEVWPLDWAIASRYGRSDVIALYASATAMIARERDVLLSVLSG